MLIMAVGSPFPWGFAIAMADGLTSLSKIGVVGGFYLTWNLIGESSICLTCGKTPLTLLSIINPPE